MSPQFDGRECMAATYRVIAGAFAVALVASWIILAQAVDAALRDPIAEHNSRAVTNARMHERSRAVSPGAARDRLDANGNDAVLRCRRGSASMPVRSRCCATRAGVRLCKTVEAPLGQRLAQSFVRADAAAPPRARHLPSRAERALPLQQRGL